MKSLFDVPQRSNKAQDSATLKKSKKKSTTGTVRKSGASIVDKVKTAVAMIETHLGQYRDETLVIRTEEALSDYIDAILTEGICGVDTETTGLDPVTDSLVGIGLYAPGNKTAYIPVGHISYVTGQKVKNQLPLDVVGKYLSMLQDCNNRPFVDMDFFNASFDIRFIMNATGVRLKCTHEAYLCARCLNENEASNSLKPLHQKYVLKGKEDAFKFDELMKGLNFAYMPIDTGAIYAAHDPKITYELAEFQRNIFETREDLQDVRWVFENIEMPCIDAVIDLENTGVAFDMEYAQKLHEKYHKILDEKKENFDKACTMYRDEIANYSGKVRLDDPINIQSVPQLQVLLYDIAKIEPPIDKKTKKPTRSTSEENLKKLKHPLADAILDYREFSTIVSTFIDKLPDCVKDDGRIHCKFNQYGADTGRFSSNDPNLQNIPSHNKDIRKMFKATDGYVMMSADYSQQEPKCMTMMCQDPLMINAYKEGKDLYAEIAAMSFNTTYENCLEFRPDGTTNPDGKERRSQAKSILLGVLYGRGVPSIAEQLGTTTKKAQAIKDSVFKGFPAIEDFEKDSLRMAEELGYVTTLWGRKRRLPDMMLPDFSFEYINKQKGFDPLDFDNDSDDYEEEVPEAVIRKWMRKINNAWGQKRKAVIDEAKLEGIKITDNTKRKDVTKVVNARIQGSAADMTKLAMIKLNSDKELKELGFRMLIPIHDEILAECPKENAKRVVERFAQIMSEAPGEKFTIPISCDVEVTDRWYGTKMKAEDYE